MKEHGYFEMKIVAQTLIVTCFDCWNIETAIRLCEEYKNLSKKIYNTPWACLVDLSHWELCTPEASDEIIKLNEWADKHNQKYEVIVCNTALQQALLKNIHQGFTNVETHFCENIDQAYQWLQTRNVLQLSSVK